MRVDQTYTVQADHHLFGAARPQAYQELKSQGTASFVAHLQKFRERAGKSRGLCRDVVASPQWEALWGLAQQVCHTHTHTRPPARPPAPVSSRFSIASR